MTPLFRSHSARLNENRNLVPHSRRIDETIHAPLLRLIAREVEDPGFRQVTSLANRSVALETLRLARRDEFVPVDVRRQILLAGTLERISAAAPTAVRGESAGRPREGMEQSSRAVPVVEDDEPAAIEKAREAAMEIAREKPDLRTVILSEAKDLWLFGTPLRIPRDPSSLRSSG